MTTQKMKMKMKNRFWMMDMDFPVRTFARPDGQSTIKIINKCFCMNMLIADNCCFATRWSATSLTFAHHTQPTMFPLTMAVAAAATMVAAGPSQ